VIGATVPLGVRATFRARRLLLPVRDQLDDLGMTMDLLAIRPSDRIVSNLLLS
jgi:hypothetical protein